MFSYIGRKRYLLYFIILYNKSGNLFTWLKPGGNKTEVKIAKLRWWKFIRQLIP